MCFFSKTTTAETKTGVILIETFKTTKRWPPGSTSGGLSYLSGFIMLG